MAVKKTTNKTVESEEIIQTENTVNEEIENSNNKKKEFKESDYIVCHSITPGGLTICCKNGDYYEFFDYGSETSIKYRDLVELVQKHSDHIFLPRILIDDADFVAEFPNLKSFYENLYTVDDLREILSMPLEQMSEAILKLPDGMKTTIKGLAGAMISNGEIDSVRTIKKLSEIFELDFQLLSELFS